ncbi:zinc finger protein 32-like [Micropterus salmoides]|uniref:zinc finger protein 32-like n=1 Tax=Micropterus salmoides TaxID=27706 RepID=UPI0018ECEA07|nr:zinc finger protein 32-like [Micropterus salmoides]
MDRRNREPRSGVPGSPAAGASSDSPGVQERRGRHGLKCHRCQHCDKSFTRSGYLKIHQRVHTGENCTAVTSVGKPSLSQET